MSEEFIREVDEDLRHQQLVSLWKKYGVYIIGTAVGVILFVAVFQGYGKYMESRYAEQALAYGEMLKTLEQGETAKALEQLNALETSAVEGYQMLAAFKKADILLKEGDRMAAVSALDALAASGDVDQVYRDLARFQAATMLIDMATYEDIKARLDPLTREGNTWQFLALEMLAMSALRNGDSAEAREVLTSLVENLETPATIKLRAEQLLNIIE
ncbi:tetratricopeptide repeat protein [Luteithermobacter gelatinilyticus]|uniref:tetratricopeptide repeat protein n=1 Tax=Luteithermobacter gelatinilyticus TaxID=2582913 RepID=UPI001105D55C|nr:tetratricopeptide repeat protein [Luteithermobacter gelatinilyticus]